jgi:hypothetical protein
MIHNYRIENLKSKNVKIKIKEASPSKNCIEAILLFSKTFETKKSTLIKNVEWMKN